MDSSTKEYGFVVKIFDSLKQVAIDNGVKGIKRVILEVGDGLLMSRENLILTWKEFLASQNEPLLKNCEMLCEGIRMQSKCKDCNKTFDTTKFGKTCPYCSGENTIILQGMELTIKQIEVFDY